MMAFWEAPCVRICWRQNQMLCVPVILGLKSVTWVAMQAALVMQALLVLDLEGHRGGYLHILSGQAATSVPVPSRRYNAEISLHMLGHRLLTAVSSPRKWMKVFTGAGSQRRYSSFPPENSQPESFFKLGRSKILGGESFICHPLPQ